MIRRSTLLALEIALALAAAAILAVGALCWRLASGPIPLPSIQRYVEAELSAAREGRPVRLHDVELAWSPQRRGLEVRARNVTALDTKGRVLSRSDEVALGLSIPRLLTGRLALERVTFRGGEASLVLGKDGSAALAFGPPGSAPDIVFPPAPGDEPVIARVNRVLDGLAQTLRPLGPGGALRGIRVERLKVSIVEEGSGARWTASNATFVLARERNVLRVHADVPLQGARGPAPLELALTTDPAFEAAVVELKVKGAPIPALAPGLPALAAIDAPITAAISANLDRKRGVDRFDGDLTIGRGSIRFPAGPVAVDGGRFRGRYDVADDALVIEEAALAGSRTRVRGDGRLERASMLLRSAGEDDADFSVDFKSVDLDMPGVLAGPIALSDVKATGVASRKRALIAFNDLQIGIDKAVVRGSGDLYWAAGKDGRWRPGVRAEGRIDGTIGPRTVLGLWPLHLANGARTYLDGALKAGALTNVKVKADVTPAMIEQGDIPNSAIDLTFDFAEAHVLYVEAMDPIVGGRGTARLQGNSFTLQLEQGRAGALALSRGRIDMPRLNPKGALASFSGRAEGDARAVVNLLLKAPIGLAEHIPADPATIVGAGAADFTIRRPMLSEVPAQNYRYTIEARFDGVGGVLKQNGATVSNWQMRVSGDERALTFAGPLTIGASRADLTWTQSFDGSGLARVAVNGQFQTADLERLGYPVEVFARGPVTVAAKAVMKGAEVETASVSGDLGGALAYLPNNFWRKLPGIAATVKFDAARADDGTVSLTGIEARSAGLELAGSAKLRAGDGAIIEARMDRALIDGRAAGTASLRLRPDGVNAVVAEGALFNVSPFITPAPALDPKVAAALPAPFARKPQPFPMDVQMRAQKLVFNADAAVTGGRLTMLTDGVAITRLAVDGADPGGKPVTLAITPRPGLSTGRITFRAEDAGFAWKAITGQANVRGGAAQADGVWTPGAPGTAKLTLLMTDFQIVDMPVMARLLSSVGSLQGLASMLNGSGIAFSSLEAPLTLADGRVTLGECRMSGPSLGLTAKGRIDLDTGALFIDGVVVPSYGLNSMLSGLPIVGSLLTSRRGEGVVGITYSVKGPAEAARVGVNPLSALTPGILRRIFEPIAPRPRTPAPAAAAASKPPG